MIVEILLYIVLFSWILPLILPEKHWTRYYACYFVFSLYISMSLVMFVFFNLVLPQKHVRRLAVITARIHSYLVGIEWEFRNGNPLKHEKRAIIIGNHQSVFDSLAFLYISLHLGECVPVIKQELRYYWPLTLLGFFYGIIYVDRNNSKAAIQQLNNNANAHFRRYDNSQILIFPEGTRNKQKLGSGLLPFKKGGFKLAIDRGLPILPVVISPYYFIEKNKSFARGKVIISYLGPIQTTDLGQDDIGMLMDKTRTLMEIEYNKLICELNLKNDVK